MSAAPAQRTRSAQVRSTRLDPPEVNPPTVSVLASLRSVPGAVYGCVWDRRADRAVDEFGAAEPVVVQAVVALTTIPAASGVLGDVMITTTAHYHLVRPVSSAGSDGSRVVYLRLTREHATLAGVRRSLAAACAAVDPAAADVRRLPAVPGRTGTMRQRVPPLLRHTSSASVSALPRRTPALRPRVAPPPPEIPPSSRARAGVPAWHNDLSTMKRLLSQLGRTA